MGLVLVKCLLLLLGTDFIEVCLLLYENYLGKAWTFAFLFPVLAPAIIAIGLHKNKYPVKVLASIASMLSLLIIQNVSAIVFGDDGAVVGMLFFSLIFTVVPFVLYNIVIAVRHFAKQKTPGGEFVS